MPEGPYILRRIAPDASTSTSTRNARSPMNNSVANDAAAVEDIIRRAVDQSRRPSPGPSGSSNPDFPPGDDVAQLRAQLSSLNKVHQEALYNLEQGHIAFKQLEAKHGQFVEANIAFTQWRDDMERQKQSWADANAKFAKRHEENKVARAKLESKLAATLADLEEVKERYAKAKVEITRLSGRNPNDVPPSPPLPSQTPGAIKESDIAAARKIAQAGPSAKPVRTASNQPNQQYLEQTMLRERLTTDMFTLSQKVLEERASRAEELRAQSERRIYDLENELREVRELTARH